MQAALISRRLGGGRGLNFFEVVLASAAANLAFALPVSGLAGRGPPQAAWAGALHLTGMGLVAGDRDRADRPWDAADGALGLAVATVVAPAGQPILGRWLRSAAAAGSRNRRRHRPASTEAASGTW